VPDYIKLLVTGGGDPSKGNLNCGPEILKVDSDNDGIPDYLEYLVNGDLSKNTLNITETSAGNALRASESNHKVNESNINA